MPAQCANCGFIFESTDEVGQPCPRCGSLDRRIHSHQDAKAHGFLKLKKKGASSKHKKARADYELQQGERIGKDGKLVSIERVIDRDSEHYTEVVKDKDGNVIANKDERLSEHK